LQESATVSETVVANVLAADQLFGEIGFNLCDIVVTALRQAIQIELSENTSFRPSSEKFGDVSNAAESWQPSTRPL
jgi:hypothetical protein